MAPGRKFGFRAGSRADYNREIPNIDPPAGRPGPRLDFEASRFHPKVQRLPLCDVLSPRAKHRKQNGNIQEFVLQSAYRDVLHELRFYMQVFRKGRNTCGQPSKRKLVLVRPHGSDLTPCKFMFYEHGG